MGQLLGVDAIVRLSTAATRRIFAVSHATLHGIVEHPPLCDRASLREARVSDILPMTHCIPAATDGCSQVTVTMNSYHNRRAEVFAANPRACESQPQQPQQARGVQCGN
jgi:hypothetical protein